MSCGVVPSRLPLQGIAREEVAMKDAIEKIRLMVNGTHNRRYCPPPWTIDDLLQETHRRLCGAYGPEYLELVESGSLSTADIFRVIDQAFSAARSTYYKRRQRGLPCIEFTSEIPKHLAQPDVDHDLRILVEEEIAKLDERDRRIVAAKHSGLAVSEICELVGVSRATVSRTVAAFRQNISSLLQADVE